jgi:predicted small lipoprotein YifL
VLTGAAAPEADIDRCRMHERPSVAVLLLVALAAAALTAACGKKGPPLPPFAKAPAAPAEVSVRRLGNRVEIRFTVPTGDLDGQRPANIDRIEVWALTGPLVQAPTLMKYGTLVGTVPVRRPPPPAPEVEEGTPAPPPSPPQPGLDQGQPGLVVDELDADDLTPVTIPELEKTRQEAEKQAAERLERLGPPRLQGPLLGPPLPAAPTRYYVVLGRNGGRKGATSRPLAVALTAAPPSPGQPTGVAAETYLELTWPAPQGLRKPVHAGTAVASPGRAGSTAAPRARRPAQAPTAAASETIAPAPVADDEEPEAADEAPAPAPAPAAIVTPAEGTPAEGAAAEPAAKLLNSRTLTGFGTVVNGYAVYEVAPPHLTPAPIEPGAVPPLPRKLTPQPLSTTTWRDSAIEVGTERCYAVRTVETSGGSVIESEASPVLCISPTDTFPPKAPANLAAVASEGAISLIWEANTEPDLAGYIVLRGESPGATLRPLMSEPIKETTYRDTATRAGVRYVYTVVAVDAATPQNVSTQSNRVEETAR